MLETSMSEVAEFQRCRRKYYYHRVRGLNTRGASGTMDFGTVIHAALEEVFSWYDPEEKSYDLQKGHEAIDKIKAEGRPDKLTKIVRPMALNEEDWQRAHDVLDYYWANTAKYDKHNVISREVPYHLETAGWRIRGTFDKLTTEGDPERMVLYDYKTTGDIKGSYAFLDLDFQVWFYQLLAFREFGQPVEFVYDLIRNKVPTELTKTGRVSKASKDPEDYLKRIRITRSASELDAFHGELNNILDDMRFHRDKQPPLWPRSPIKNGVQSCGSCAYFDVCKAELTGSRVPDSVLSMTFDINKEP